MYRLAENVYGIRGKYANFLELVADAGIGGGLIQDGKLSQGMRGLGHISLDIHGPRCQCGNYGCVEIFATISRIVEWARTQELVHHRGPGLQPGTGCHACAGKRSRISGCSHHHRC